MEETRKKVKKNHQLKENFNVLWPNKMVPTLTKQIGLGYEKLQFTTECVKCNKFTTTPNNKKYGNNTSHITTCYGAVQVDKITSTALAEQKSPKGSALMEFIKSDMDNPQEEDICACIYFALDEDVPPQKVESEAFQKRMNAEKTPKLTVQDTMFHLGEFVEENITKEMKGKVGMILNYGLSHLGMHYVAIFS